MRRTEALICKMDAAEDRFRFLAIVVKFGDGAGLVSSDDAQRLENLEQAVGTGGQTIGFIGVDKDEDRCSYEALPGHEKEAPLLAFLSQLQLSCITGDWKKFPGISKSLRRRNRSRY